MMAGASTKRNTRPNPSSSWMARWTPDKDYLYLGTIDKTTIALVAAHPKGLRLYIKPPRGYPTSTIIPGEYGLDEVIQYLISKTGSNDQNFTERVLSAKWPEYRGAVARGERPRRKTVPGHDAHDVGVYGPGDTHSLAWIMRCNDIRRGFHEGGLWRRRGRLRWPVPQSFFEMISLEEFVLGSTHSYRTWWRRYLANAYASPDSSAKVCWNNILIPLLREHPLTREAIARHEEAAAEHQRALESRSEIVERIAREVSLSPRFFGARAVARQSESGQLLDVARTVVKAGLNAMIACRDSESRGLEEALRAVCDAIVATREAYEEVGGLGERGPAASMSQRVALSRIQEYKLRLLMRRLVPANDAVTAAIAPMRAARLSEHRAVYRAIRQLTASGALPESPTSVSRWNRIARVQRLGSDQRRSFLATLGRYYSWGWITSPAWGQFAATLAQKYGSLIVRHELMFAGRDLAVVTDWLRRLPDNAPTLLDDCINVGVPIGTLIDLAITRSRDLQRAGQIARRVNAAVKSVGFVTLGPSYVPPEIELPAGWLFADAQTYPGLSDRYECCISTHGYGRRVAEGSAHIFFREDVSDGGGALCYAVTDGRGWRISEIASYDNEPVRHAFMREAEAIVEALNRLDRGRHAGCSQINTQDEAIRIALMGLTGVEQRIALAVAGRARYAA